MKIDLSQIIVYFNKLSDQLRYSILAGVVVVIIILDAVFLVWPQIGAIFDVNDQIKKTSDDTQQVLVDRQRIGSLKVNLGKQHDQLSALQAKVRPIQEIPVILSTISSIAKEYGVKIDQMSPEYGQLETLASPEGKYIGIPVMIKARCGYHNFGHFLNKVENADLFFMMDDFIIENNGVSPNIHLFSMTIKIILKE